MNNGRVDGGALRGRPIIALLDDAVWINVLRLVMASIILVGNVFLLILILWYRQLRKSHSNLAIIMLAISDIFIGAGIFIRGVYALYTVSLGVVCFDRYTCITANYVQGLGLSQQHIAVLAIGVERFLALHRPMIYRARGRWPYMITAFLLSSVFVSATYTISVYAELEDAGQVNVCTMGTSAGPYHAIVMSVYSNFTLVLLVGIYMSNLAMFFRQNSSGTMSKKLSGLQRRITRTIFILLLVYIVFWLIVPTSLLIAKFTRNPQLIAGYITYSIGFLTGLNTIVGLIVVVTRHEEIRRFSFQMLGIKSLTGKLQSTKFMSGQISHVTGTTRHERSNPQTAF